MKIPHIRNVKPFCYVTERTARKDYVCDCCNQIIPRRSKYFLNTRSVSSAASL